MKRTQNSPTNDSTQAKCRGDQEAHVIVAEVERKWAQCAKAGSSAAISALYLENAVFFGSKARQYFGRDEIAQYFEAIPVGYLLGVTFSDRCAAKLSDDVIVSGSYVAFRVSQPTTPISMVYRITFTLFRTDLGWKIAQHHASPREQSKT